VHRKNRIFSFAASIFQCQCRAIAFDVFCDWSNASVCLAEHEKSGCQGQVFNLQYSRLSKD